MDQYFVVSPDGKEYGPADLPGLLRWVREGRVLKSTQIRKGSDAPIAAELLPELADAFSTELPLAIPPSVTTVLLPTEFRSWDFIAKAWKLVKPHWLPLVGMFVILAVITCIGVVPYLGACVLFVISGALQVGINRAILGLLAGRPPKLEMMFSGFDRFGQAFLATLVAAVLISLGMVFLIVPGVILAIMWMFVSLIMAETELDFWAAMQASAKLTSGYRWELFCLALACFVVAWLGLLACCVGIFIAQPVILTAIALAYRFLQGRQAGRAA